MKTGNPRHGSMQFWPRVRSNRIYARVRSWLKGKEAVPLGFAGYKVGMTHVMFEATNPNVLKPFNKTIPVTIIECPPIKIGGARFYKKSIYGSKAATEVFVGNDKELGRKLSVSKKDQKEKLSKLNPEDYDYVNLIVYTQPKLTSIGKKKPEIFEVALGGSVQDQFNYVKENLGKELKVSDLYSGGEQLDFHNITTGKGFQGPVKRFGVSIRSHKSEKTKRGPGSLGGWCGQGHMMYRIAHAGQMGYHQRTEYNKWLMKISDDVDEVNPKGGFLRYGFVKNSYILVAGSVGGPSKRIVRFNLATRPAKRIPKDVPAIKYISTESKQRR